MKKWEKIWHKPGFYELMQSQRNKDSPNSGGRLGRVSYAKNARNFKASDQATDEPNVAT